MPARPFGHLYLCPSAPLLPAELACLHHRQRLPSVFLTRAHTHTWASRSLSLAPLPEKGLRNQRYLHAVAIVYSSSFPFGFPTAAHWLAIGDGPTSIPAVSLTAAILRKLRSRRTPPPPPHTRDRAREERFAPPVNRLSLRGRRTQLTPTPPPRQKSTPPLRLRSSSSDGLGRRRGGRRGRGARDLRRRMGGRVPTAAAPEPASARARRGDSLLVSFCC